MRKKIKIDVYQCTVHLIACKNIDREASRIHKKYGDLDKVEGTEGYSCAFDMKDYYVLIEFDDISINTIGHEVYHTVRNILNHRDINDDETGAWLCGLLVDEATKFFTKSQLKWRSQTDSKTSESTPT